MSRGTQTNGSATDRNCAGGNGRQSEDDDKFSFRQVGSYTTQALIVGNTGLKCKAKVKVRNRKIGFMITEDDFKIGE